MSRFFGRFFRDFKVKSQRCGPLWSMSDQIFYREKILSLGRRLAPDFRDFKVKIFTQKISP